MRAPGAGASPGRGGRVIFFGLAGRRLLRGGLLHRRLPAAAFCRCLLGDLLGGAFFAFFTAAFFAVAFLATFWRRSSSRPVPSWRSPSSRPSWRPSSPRSFFAGDLLLPGWPLPPLLHGLGAGDRRALIGVGDGLLDRLLRLPTIGAGLLLSADLARLLRPTSATVTVASGGRVRGRPIHLWPPVLQWISAAWTSGRSRLRNRRLLMVALRPTSPRWRRDPLIRRVPPTARPERGALHPSGRGKGRNARSELCRSNPSSASNRLAAVCISPSYSISSLPFTSMTWPVFQFEAVQRSQVGFLDQHALEGAGLKRKWCSPSGPCW